MWYLSHKYLLGNDEDMNPFYSWGSYLHRGYVRNIIKINCTIDFDNWWYWIITYTKSYNWFCYDDENDNAQCALSLVLQLSIDVIAIPMIKHIVHYHSHHHSKINCKILYICWYWLRFCIWCNLFWMHHLQNINQYHPIYKILQLILLWWYKW